MAFSSVHASRPSRVQINTSQGEFIKTDNGTAFLHTEVAKRHGATGKVHRWTEGFAHAKTYQTKNRYARLLREVGYYEQTLELAKDNGQLRQKCKDVIVTICDANNINFNQIMEDLDVNDIANLIMSCSNTHNNEDMSVASTVTYSDDDTVDENQTMSTTDSDSTWQPRREVRMMAQETYGYEASENISMVTCSSMEEDDEDSSSDYYEEMELGW